MVCQHRSKVWVNGWCDVAHRYCAATQESTCKYNKPTNADRIRAMSDEELARFLCCINDCYDGKCPGKHLCQPGSNGLVEWLKQPAEGE